MTLIKHHQTLVLVTTDGEVVAEYPLITSVVYYKASWFERHLRWQVQDDADMLSCAVLRAMTHLTDEDLKTIQFYEQYYQELKQPSASYNSSQKCITSKFGYTFSSTDELSDRKYK